MEIKQPSDKEIEEILLEEARERNFEEKDETG